MVRDGTTQSSDCVGGSNEGRSSKTGFINGSMELSGKRQYRLMSIKEFTADTGHNVNKRSLMSLASSNGIARLSRCLNQEGNGSRVARDLRSKAGVKEVRLYNQD